MSLWNIVYMSIVEIAGDFALENYAHTNSLRSLAGGVGGYACIVFLLIKSLRNSNILTVNALWDGVSTILESLAAFVFLGERFENPLQYAGLGLLISGIFLIKFKGNGSLKN